MDVKRTVSVRAVCIPRSNRLYYSITKKEKNMKIESKAVIRRRIANIEQDIKSVRNSGNNFRMIILYRQLTASMIKLQNMKN